MPIKFHELICQFILKLLFFQDESGTNTDQQDKLNFMMVNMFFKISKHSSGTWEH